MSPCVFRGVPQCLYRGLSGCAHRVGQSCFGWIIGERLYLLEVLLLGPLKGALRRRELGCRSIMRGSEGYLSEGSGEGYFASKCILKVGICEVAYLQAEITVLSNSAVFGRKRTSKGQQFTMKVIVV